MTQNGETSSNTVTVAGWKIKTISWKSLKPNLEVRKMQRWMDCTDKPAVLVCNHGNRYDPGSSPFSQLLLAACWPPLCLLLPTTESEAACKGALFSQTHTSIVTLHLILKVCLETKARWLLCNQHRLSCVFKDNVHKEKWNLKWSFSLLYIVSLHSPLTDVFIGYWPELTGTSC